MRQTKFLKACGIVRNLQRMVHAPFQHSKCSSTNALKRFFRITLPAFCSPVPLVDIVGDVEHHVQCKHQVYFTQKSSRLSPTQTLRQQLATMDERPVIIQVRMTFPVTCMSRAEVPPKSFLNEFTPRCNYFSQPPVVRQRNRQAPRKQTRRSVNTDETPSKMEKSVAVTAPMAASDIHSNGICFALGKISRYSS